MEAILIKIQNYNVIGIRHVVLGDSGLFICTGFDEPYIFNIDNLNSEDIEYIEYKAIASDNPNHKLPGISYKEDIEIESVKFEVDMGLGGECIEYGEYPKITDNKIKII